MMKELQEVGPYDPIVINGDITNPFKWPYKRGNWG